MGSKKDYMTLHNFIVERLILARGKIRRRGNILSLWHNGKELSFIRTEWAAYPLNEIFINGTYSELDVKGKNVVDVGASIADSPIYFILNGAKHVYGYEPDKERYNMAIENIRRNGMEGKITMYNRKYDGKHTADAVMKADCEGCEYSLVENKAIRSFNEIILEYHNGNTKLVKYLSKLGFSSTVLPTSNNLGVLHAVRQKRQNSKHTSSIDM